MALAFKYLESHYAIEEAEYPYVSGTTTKAGTCEYDSRKHTEVQVTDFKQVTPMMRNQLLASISMGPTSVAIEADRDVFRNYESGILTDSSCGKALNHGVLAVGWGNDN